MNPHLFLFHVVNIFFKNIFGTNPLYGIASHCIIQFCMTKAIFDSIFRIFQP